MCVTICYMLSELIAAAVLDAYRKGKYMEAAKKVKSNIKKEIQFMFELGIVIGVILSLLDAVPFLGSLQISIFVYGIQMAGWHVDRHYYSSRYNAVTADYRSCDQRSCGDKKNGKEPAVFYR